MDWRMYKKKGNTRLHLVNEPSCPPHRIYGEWANATRLACIFSKCLHLVCHTIWHNASEDPLAAQVILMAQLRNVKHAHTQSPVHVDVQLCMRVLHNIACSVLCFFPWVGQPLGAFAHVSIVVPGSHGVAHVCESVFPVKIRGPCEASDLLADPSPRRTPRRQLSDLLPQPDPMV